MSGVVALPGRLFDDLGDTLKRPELRRVSLRLGTFDEYGHHFLQLFFAQLRRATRAAFRQKACGFVFLPCFVPGIRGSGGHGKMFGHPCLGFSCLEVDPRFQTAPL